MCQKSSSPEILTLDWGHCTQFLASAMRRDHPSHELVNLPHGPRLMKHTLTSRYLPALTPYLNDNGVISEVSYKRTLNCIHASAIETARNNQNPNKVLQCQPPKVYSSESKLPRTVRITLRRLRSAECINLETSILKTANSQRRSLSQVPYSPSHNSSPFFLPGISY
jgi:hypothetical protein